MTETKAPLSTRGYKGTNDYYPEEQRVRQWMFKTIHQSLQKFGYDEIEGPTVEPLALYAAKSSEEIVREQLYSFKTRGETALAIRPEMTPTVARMFAAKAKQLPLPVRWYCLPNCMRAERPQRGRSREFTQLNVDAFGGLAVDEDVEVLLTVLQLFKDFRAQPGQFTLKLNHRGLVNHLLYSVLSLPKEKSTAFIGIFDKKDKMTEDTFHTSLKEGGVTDEQIETIKRFLSATLEDLPHILGNCSAIQELRERVSLLQQAMPDFSEQIVFDPGIMRGFDYYTGVVFEVFDNHPQNNRAIMGGGRYENLVQAFGCDPMPGIGYGLGDAPLLNFLQVNDLIPDLKKPTQIAVLRFSPEDRTGALKIATHLRNLGLKVESPLGKTKFGKQIQQAEKRGLKCVAFAGEDELKEDKFCLKWLETGEQKTYGYSDDLTEVIASL